MLLKSMPMTKKCICYSIFIILILIPFNTVSSQSVIITKKARPVPLESFKHSDIGNPAITGTVQIQKDGFDVTAGGVDIWGKKDEFNYVYVQREGDFDFASRIDSLSAPHLYTKAGIMAREDLTAGCRHIYFQVFPNNSPRNKNNGGYEYQYRQAKEGEMKAVYPESSVGTPPFPVSYPNTWIRLQRVKNDFTGYYSTDGKQWKVYTTYSLELPTKIYIGLAVTSHKATESATAKFRNIGEIKH
jgi:regulation of enolase protein 1 (concanavalin A-like superfamily)